MTLQAFDEWYKLGNDKNIGVGVLYEAIITSLYERFVAAGDICIDGGVNRGYHLFRMSECVAADGFVVGFEALPDLVHDLNQRINSLSAENIILIGKAISSKPGRVGYTHVASADAYSGIRRRHDIPKGAEDSIQIIEAACTTIDEELQQLGMTKEVTFIKLDLEGGELDALRGSRRTLESNQTLVVFENGRQASADLYGYDKNDWFDFFESIDYRTYDIFGRPFDRNSWESARIPWYFIAFPYSYAKAMDYLYSSHFEAVRSIAKTLHNKCYETGSHHV